MSSQIAGKQDAKSALTPKLRFPEFRDADGWNESGLADITSAIFDGTHQTPTYTAEGVPFYSVENLVSGNANKFISKGDHQLATKKNKPEKGDILITRIGKIGYSEVVSWSHDFSIYVTLAVIKRSPKFNSNFLHYFIQSANYQKEILSKSLLNAVPCKINMDSLRRTRIHLAGPAEQQKIAECLTTLDEVIAAQRQKLDALKTHKKGLMQQLFPREGETLPRLRFPEFQGALEWESGPLGSIFQTTSGGTPSRSEKSHWGGNIPWVTTSLVNFGVITKAEEFISKDGLHNSSAKLLPEGTVLIAMYGQGKTRGQVALLGIEAATNQACAAVLPNNGIEPYFVFLNFAGRYEELRDLSNSGGQENLSQGLIREIPFSYPSDAVEQKAITSCVSSLDDLITAQTTKLESLKTHKQGLMQQLFPSTEAVEA